MRIRATITAVMLAAALATAAVQQSAAQDAPAARITVTGEGRVDALPDIATIALGVTTEAATAAAALAANSAQVTEVLATLAAAGIAPRDVQTSGLALNPRWEQTRADPQGTPQITGYIASNGVTVRVRALGDLGTVLDRVVRSGANTLNGLTFGIAAPEPLLDEARRRAVADARRKAELYADAAGVTLGPVRSLDEGGGGGQPAPMFRMAEAMATDASVPVSGGEVSLAATVTVVFDLTAPAVAP